METINIQIDISDTQNKYSYITDNEKFYKSPKEFISFQNWRKSRRGDYDPLESFVDGIAASGYAAIKHALSKPVDKAIRKVIDNAVKDAVIKSGGTWTD